MMWAPIPCHWCIGYEPADPDSFCLAHRAEWEGVSVAELDRRTRAEWLDTL